MSLLRRLISGTQPGTQSGARTLNHEHDTREAREISDKVAAIPFWFHSIDLGMGVVTPGLKSLQQHKQELLSFRFPDLQDKTVLDIGAWDGFYSFAAERLGATRAVALDHHGWALDREAKNRYKAECKERGVPQQHPKFVSGLWRFDELPGKRGFDLAHVTLGRRVEAVVGDLMQMDLQTLGQFDVVLYLGVLYHMENPLESLRRVRSLTKNVAIIETEAVEIGGFENKPLCESFPSSAQLLDDPTNFCAPNASALVGLCETAGFESVELLTTSPKPSRTQIARYRLVAHAYV